MARGHWTGDGHPDPDLERCRSRRCHRARPPPVDQLEISPRVLHVLQRHGYLTIESVETASDPALMLLSNMDTRGLQEVRRAATLWRYRRWQERGFPAGGA